MSSFFGIDTSNYTTSVAVYDSDNDIIISHKKLLPVKKGEIGLRQSDAVFHHTVQLPDLVGDLFNEYKGDISAIGVSSKPRDVAGSYMPCFLVGLNLARCLSSVFHKQLYTFSHQAGHIAAALHSSKRMELVENKFIAFQVSGGTTEALLVSPSENEVFDIKIIADSLDLKAGQAVDRVGAMLGLPFPSGQKVDELAQKSNKKYSINPFVKDGNCSFSGIENKCHSMLSQGESAEDICRYCIDYIMQSLRKMTKFLLNKHGNIPLVFSGGVMSNTIIKDTFTKEFNAAFAQPEFSSDNAAGAAILTFIKESRK
ncbi:MAG TPA: peptidase M22 [Clostridia bacterium]|nr:peptidase M22 [Clostridia bacterium]